MKFLHLLHLRRGRKQQQDHSTAVRRLDSLVMFLAWVMPLTILPQVIKMHITKSVGDVSLLMFALLFALTIPWLVYGVVHKEKVLISNNIMWIAVYFTAIVSYAMYV